MSKPLRVRDLMDHLALKNQESFVVVTDYEWGVSRITANCISSGIALLQGTGEEIDVVHLDYYQSTDHEDFGGNLEMKD